MAMCSMAPAKFSRQIVVDFCVKNVVDFCVENARNVVDMLTSRFGECYSVLAGYVVHEKSIRFFTSAIRAGNRAGNRVDFGGKFPRPK
eukprot:8866557-Lingulodinium_polyedra.AAC.1